MMSLGIRYSFILNRQKFALTLLLPKEVFEDQMKIKKKSLERSSGYENKKDESKRKEGKEVKREKKNNNDPLVRENEEVSGKKTNKMFLCKKQKKRVE